MNIEFLAKLDKKINTNQYVFDSCKHIDFIQSFPISRCEYEKQSNVVWVLYKCNELEYNQERIFHEALIAEELRSLKIEVLEYVEFRKYRYNIH